jgi:hypothetical protein
MTNRPKSKRCKDNKASILLECLLSGCLFFAHTVYSQPLNGENELKDAVDHAMNTLPASQLGIYNGRDYTPVTITAAGHPYFPTGKLEPGTITYDGIPYNEVYLIFDASLQCVVIEDYAGNKICPVEEKVESFTIGVHTFKRLSDIPGLRPGFYDVLVDGKLFARRSKSGGGMQWKSSTDYFFLNKGRLFQLMNKKSVLESMADKGNDVGRYIRINKLSFSKKKETSLIEVVSYYSSLEQH